METLIQLWGVWARVSGGYTGHRESWCKDKGKVITFETREGATGYAAELNMRMNHRRATANFHYAARSYNGE